MQPKLRGSDIPAATEATLLRAAAFVEFKQHVARRCILAAAVLGRRQKWFLYTPLRQAEFLRDIGGLAHRIILRCVITKVRGNNESSTTVTPEDNQTFLPMPICLHHVVAHKPGYASLV